VCLAKWNEDYESGTKHNFYSIKKWFNSIKREQYPFVYEVSKWVTEAAISDLDKAFKKMYKNQNKHPKFHKKGVNDSFRIDGSAIKFKGKQLCLPKKLNIKMAEEFRYANATNIYNVTVSRRADKWFASICCEIPEAKRENQANSKVGIDIGIKTVATLSDGTIYDNNHIENKHRKRLAQAQKSLARKVKGSKNWHKQHMKLARIYYKANCIRQDFTHKMTTQIANKYNTVCLEDLNVNNMLSNHRLAKAIADVRFAEVRRQLEYKANKVLYVGTFKPSSKTCCLCGTVHDMPLSKRKMVCRCGNNIDRDLNAAINILRWATPKVKSVD
jgi:putative transposase